MKIITTITCIFLFSCIIVSCKVEKNEVSWTKGREIQQTTNSNEYLELSLLDTSSYPNGDKRYIIWVENVSEKSIWFPKDLNVLIYYMDDDGNILGFIESKIDYRLSDEKVLEPIDEGVNGTLFSVILRNENIDEKESFVISIAGKIMRNSEITSEMVGATIIIKDT